ncbi:hypothetical protein ACFX15_041258 [Malus domestica]
MHKQPCLGGDCKSLMVVNVSQFSSFVGDTLCLLIFASTVYTCEGISRRQMTKTLQLASSARFGVLRTTKKLAQPATAHSSVKRTTVNTLYLGMKNLQLDSPAPSDV